MRHRRSAVWVQWDGCALESLSARDGTAVSSRYDPMPRVAVDEAGTALVVWVQGDDTRRDLVVLELPKE